MRIHNRKASRPKRFPQVPCIGNDRVPNPNEERIPTCRAARSLRFDGNEGASCRESEQGQLLPHQLGKTPGREDCRIGFLLIGEHAAQRPVIPKQKNARQGDDLRLGHQAHSVEKRDHCVAARARIRGIPAVSAKCEQEEHHAEEVLSFCNPNDRLDIDGMQSEKRGHHCAAVDVTRCSLQHPEQQDDIQRVQEQVHVVMPRRIELKKLNIRGVRQPGQRMPVGSGEGGEGPPHRAPMQTGLHMEIVEDVVRVIVVGKWVIVDRIVKGDSCEYQEKTECEFLAA